MYVGLSFLILIFRWGGLKLKEKRYFYITPEDYATAEKNGIKKATLERRVKFGGWDIDRAITQPVGARKTGNWAKWKDKAVVCYGTFASRIRNGMTTEQAALTPFIPHDKRHPNNTAITDEQFLIAEKNGIPKVNVLQRYNACGWSIEDAITIPVMSKKQAAMISVEKRRENGRLKNVGG